MYKLLAIIGKSGTGKDSIFSAVTQNPTYYPKVPFKRVIGTTTRPKRDGEIDGVHYHFISYSDFFTLDQTNSLFGVSGFRGWYYGTTYTELQPNVVNIGIFDPDRIRDIIENEKDIDLKVVCIMASDKARLMRQLNREKEPDVDEIVRRYQAEKKEWEKAIFDIYPVFNETAEDYLISIATIQHIVESWDESK